MAAGDGVKFPAVPFNMTIWPAGAQPTTANAEIVRVTGISTDTFTITRAQESSSARTVVIGDQVAATITAKTLTDVETAIPAFATPAVVLGSSAAAGAASTVIRSDGTIAAFDTTVPSTQAFGDAAAIGTAAFAARRDHKHAMPALPVSPYKSGEFILVPTDTGFSIGTTTQSQLCATLIEIQGTVAVTFSSISVNVTTGAGSSTIRLGFYSLGSNGFPGALLYDLGTIDSSGTGTKTITSSFTLGPGWVWAATCAQGGAPAVRKLGLSAAVGLSGVSLVTSSMLGSSPSAPIFQQTATCTGGLPNPATAGAVGAPVMPRIELVVT